ncbi:hypothetical protein DUZ99_11950 [Xylanibacillus composti]|nr:hypothetical protein [Xylanibacillus composti]
MHLIGVLAGLLGIGAATIITKQNWGFSFVREDEQVKINLREKSTVLLLCVSIVAVIGFFVGYFCMLYLSTPMSLLATVLVLILGTGMLIYLSGKREWQEFERKRSWMGK